MMWCFWMHLKRTQVCFKGQRSALNCISGMPVCLTYRWRIETETGCMQQALCVYKLVFILLVFVCISQCRSTWCSCPLSSPWMSPLRLTTPLWVCLTTTATMPGARRKPRPSVSASRPPPPTKATRRTLRTVLSASNTKFAIWRRRRYDCWGRWGQTL